MAEKDELKLERAHNFKTKHSEMMGNALHTGGGLEWLVMEDYRQALHWWLNPCVTVRHLADCNLQSNLTWRIFMTRGGHSFTTLTSSSLSKCARWLPYFPPRRFMRTQGNPNPWSIGQWKVRCSQFQQVLLFSLHKSSLNFEHNPTIKFHFYQV